MQSQNVLSITAKLLFHQSPTLHSDLKVMLSLLLTSSSIVTIQLINCVVPMLPAVNNSDCTITVKSMYLEGF